MSAQEWLPTFFFWKLFGCSNRFFENYFRLYYTEPQCRWYEAFARGDFIMEKFKRIWIGGMGIYSIDYSILPFWDGGMQLYGSGGSGPSWG